MNGFFQQLNKLRCVTAFWWFACCGSFCAGFTVRFLCCGWLCVWGCFTWNVVVCLGWFCGLGSCCLSGWMSGLVMFEDGWCFTWNVGWWAHNVGVVSRETGILEITSWWHIGVSRGTCVGMCVVLKNEGMVFDHVTSPLPVVVGVGVFSCLMFHVKLFH